MKSFYIELPNKKEDSTGILKNYIINKIANKYPWLTMDGIDGYKNTHTSLQYAGPNDYIAFGVSPKFHVSAVRPADWYEVKDTNCYHCPFDCFNKKNKYKLLDNFDIAMKKLDEYATSIRCPLDKGYDYKWFGMPVRVYQNFVQVGNTYIPKIGNVYTLPEDLTTKQKDTIMNVIFNINVIINKAA